MSDVSRRTFLQTTAASAAAAAVPSSVLKASARIQGANDRVRIGLIGAGTRGTMVAGFFGRHKDCEVIAACDVWKTRLDTNLPRLAEAGFSKIDTLDDYRRILDRKDIDAVLIATPDHWHSPMTVDACAAGKDVYVEKPISNGVEPAWKMVEAARKHNRVVQVGLQQRQGEHFKEAAQLVREGLLGPVTHVMLLQPGAYSRAMEQPTAAPADLNWDMFQGPAPRKPYKTSRHRSWRGWYDYGGGLVTDWGVHLVDVAHWYLNADDKAPNLTSAAAQYTNDDPDREQLPEAFTITWQYDKFVMTFSNAVMSNPEFGLNGTYFHGPRGVLRVNRSGFEVRPTPPRGGGRGAAPNAPPPPPPIEGRVRRFEENYNNDPDTIAQCRNFLDCIKSRQRPTSDIEVGFHSTLPCLLGVLAIRQGRTVKWDGKKVVMT